MLLTFACARGDASGWEPLRARGAAGLPVRWEQLQLSLCVAEMPAELGLTHGDLLDLVRKGVSSWGVERRVRVTFCPGVSASAEDGRNVLAFESASSAAPAHPYARTHLRTRRSATDGFEEIVEADIQLGSMAVRATRERGREALATIIGHELGHFLGLAHACSALKRRAAAVATPTCAELEAAAETLPLMHPALLDRPRPPVLRPTARERRAVLDAWVAPRAP